MLKISGNGLCLVEAVQQAIDKDLGIKNSYNAQARKFWMEIKNRILFYNDFAPNQTSTSILKTIYDYLKKWGSYMLPIIDIMLPACATALNINIRVWQNGNGFKKVMFTQHHHRKQFTFCTLAPSMLKVYLMPHLIQTICAIIMMHSY